MQTTGSKQIDRGVRSDADADVDADVKLSPISWYANTEAYAQTGRGANEKKSWCESCMYHMGKMNFSLVVTRYTLTQSQEK